MASEKNGKPKRETFGIRIDPKIMDRIRASIAKTGVTLGRATEDAYRMYLESQK